MTRALIIALLLAAGPALADPAPPGIAAEHRLSPAEVDQVLAAAAARHRREQAAADAAGQLLPTPDVPPRGPDVHGEVRGASAARREERSRKQEIAATWKPAPARM